MSGSSRVLAISKQIFPFPLLVNREPPSQLGRTMGISMAKNTSLRLTSNEYL